MSSLLNRFSVSYNIDKSNKKLSREVQDMNLKIKNNSNGNNTNSFKEFLNEDLLQPLLNFGYDLDQVMQAFKLYKFSTVDEALYILMKDTETQKYNHRYIIKEKKRENYQDVRVQVCYLCGDSVNEHVDFASDTQIEVLNIKSFQEKEELSELEKSTNNMLKTTDIGGLLEKKLNSNSHSINNTSINTLNRKLEIKQVEIPKETLDLFEDPDVCRICFSEKLSDANIAQFACGHKFCKTCVSNHLSTNILNGKVLTIKCLYGGCPKTFTDEEVKMYIPIEIFFKFRKFKLSQMKLNNPNQNFNYCPFPDCEETVEYEVLTGSNSMVECSLGHKFCSKCKSEGWHTNGKCRNYDDFLLTQIQKNSESANYKKCPQCSVIIEKNEGCNQMKCLNCNFEFCWLCMNKYSVDHYAIYNFTGCPGMRFNTPEKKKWWNNPFLKALWLFLSFFLGLFAICVLSLFFFFFGCPYEFIKCYVNRKSDEDSESSAYGQDYEASNIQDNRESIKVETNIEQQNGKGMEYAMIGLLIFLGILCQPIYLIFYTLYGLMECYRRFSCWFYYVDY